MGTKLTIEHMQAVAKKRGGKCLSITYVNNRTQLWWRCAKGHEWDASPGSVKNIGSWCPVCAGNRSNTIEQMQALAKERNGVCLSTVYVNQSTKLRWRCQEGHEWEVIPGRVKRGGNWCSVCAKAERRLTVGSQGIKKMQAVAKKRGGKCLSITYINPHTKLRWRCQEGHEWEATGNSVKRTSWCPVCAGVLRGTIEQMQALAKEQNGVCLSTVYVNQSTKLQWRCAEGHEWEAAPGNVKNLRQWCPECAGNRPNTIEQMQALAKERNGVCLSTVYVNQSTKLRWRCQEGHEWDASPDSVKRTSWCPVCAGVLRDTIEQMQALAKKRLGKCLSTTYVNGKTKLRWRCADGHKWEARPDNIKQGQWCPACAGKLRLTLKQMQVLARTRDGECLSSRYINGHTKLRWRCAESHEWEAEPFSVKSGGWCPTCGEGNSERIVRDICEQIFGKQFPKARPKWLTNSRGNRMELDGYCKELSLAFEYQGKQHYIHSSYFYRKRAGRRATNLDQRMKDDVRKRTVCKKNGVHVIEIPYTVALGDVPAYVFRNVKNLGVAVSMRPPKKVKVSQFVLPEKLRSMQVLAKKRGGECLSTGYVNALTALRWRCAEGHEWQATPNNIKNCDQWCPECAGNRPNTIEQMQALAERYGGQCLSKRYINGHTKLRWRCAEGHEWTTALNNMQRRVKRGKWCTKCPRVV